MSVNDDVPASDNVTRLISPKEEESAVILSGPDSAPAKLRAAILLCICSLTLGSYWVFDTPGAIQSQLEGWFGDYTDADNALLYSIYSWPNVILALFGGFIIDRITGVRKGAVLFMGLIWLGQIIFCLGIQAKSYGLCVFGRFIFGLGGESLTVAQNTFVIRWFSGKYLALVFGLVLAFARVGSSINFAVTPALADYGVPFSVWFGAGICTYSLVMCLLLVALDYSGSAYVEKPEQSDDDENKVVEDPPKLSDILSLKLPVWILFFICLFFYQGVITFYQVASKIMQDTGKHFSPGVASSFLAIPNFISIGASPMFGRVVDRYGRSLTLLILAAWTLMLCHLVFLCDAYNIFFVHPAIIFVVLGFAYALGAATMWPLVGQLVPANLVSTSFGAMTSTQALGLACFPLIISKLQELPSIVDTPHKYGVPLMIFNLCVFLSSLLAIQLYFIDRDELRGKLNASAAERIEIAKAVAEENEDMTLPQ